MSAVSTSFTPPPIPAEPGTPASFTLEHYEHLVECGAFDGGFDKDVELLWGRIVGKRSGKPAKYSLEHYEYMVRCGAFDYPYNTHVEFLNGEIIQMSPAGPPHADVVRRVGEWSFRNTLGHKIQVRVQSPLRLLDGPSTPEPDISWVNDADYSQQHPEASDALLVIEVAQSSLEIDRSVKLAAYAQAAIADYWIVNLLDQQVEVYRQPKGLEYTEKAIRRGADAVSPLALPSATVTADELLAKSAG